jgi:ubiquinone biosynthesis protein COQ4
MDDTPYLLRGIKRVPTTSSTLVSSSKYLNNAAMREWMATELLRRNGPDLPTPAGSFQMSMIMSDIQEKAEINRMFAEERERSPELNKFLSERFASSFTLEDLAKYPPESVAGIFYKTMTDGGYELHLIPPFKAENDYDHWRLRQGQTHDWEHIITHGGFDSIGEVSTAFARLENIYRYFSPELACELTVHQFFAGFRFVTRMALHYPSVWHDVWSAVERGRRIGKASNAYQFARYEDVFHLTPAEAREAMGVREVEEVDTTEPSRIWNDIPAAS